MTRVLYMALLIVATGIVGPEFPFTPRQSSILVLLTVGIPTLALTVKLSPLPLYTARLSGTPYTIGLASSTIFVRSSDPTTLDPVPGRLTVTP